VDIQIYETFLELASTLNFRQASKNLDVAQSTVSNRIQALEEAYQIPLFDRSNKKVSLTRAGQMVHPYALRIVNLHKEAMKASRRSGAGGKSLSLALDTGLQSQKVLELTRQFCHDHPEVSLKIQTQDSKYILSGVLDDILDIGLVYNKSEGQQVAFVPFEKDHFVFITDKAIETYENTIHKNEILDFDLVGANYGKRFDQWLNQIVPPQYGYHIEISGGNPVDYIAGQGRAGFVLTSDIERSGYADRIKIMEVHGVELPYFQSHIIYNPSSQNLSNIMKFIDLLNRQKKSEL